MRSSAVLTLTAVSGVFATPVVKRNGGKSCPSKTPTPTWGHPTPTPTWGEPPTKPTPTWGEHPPSGPPPENEPCTGYTCGNLFIGNALNCNNVDINLGTLIGGTTPAKDGPATGVRCGDLFWLNIGNCNSITVGKEKRTTGHTDPPSPPEDDCPDEEPPKDDPPMSTPPKDGPPAPAPPRDGDQCSGSVCGDLFWANVGNCNDISITGTVGGLLGGLLGGGKGSSGHNGEQVNGMRCGNLFFLNILNCNNVNVNLGIPIKGL
ncbi:uncharacterized protein AB675_835 [Cyphellophora attinorum]|uniref:Uncharacterized protein n=1 Tax=Cyphellophora attinorum TaxID=1664694 RepID=A0A0N0NRU6_9EURO|nr:uncharacterized protein AB675_835 [Phialophora attinorum]KPI45501.1 hypothetical protein AB675_835 [Phialophora attinorum]